MKKKMKKVKTKGKKIALDYETYSIADIRKTDELRKVYAEHHASTGFLDADDLYSAVREGLRPRAGDSYPANLVKVATRVYAAVKKVIQAQGIRVGLR